MKMEEGTARCPQTHLHIEHLAVSEVYPIPEKECSGNGVPQFGHSNESFGGSILNLGRTAGLAA